MQNIISFEEKQADILDSSSFNITANNAAAFSWFEDELRKIADTVENDMEYLRSLEDEDRCDAATLMCLDNIAKEVTVLVQKSADDIFKKWKALNNIVKHIPSEE